jgi:hypothetical protein
MITVGTGDIIKGGRQDRTLPYDSIIEAKSGQVPIDSFCVEHGRWSQRGDEPAEKFSSSSNNVKQLMARDSTYISAGSSQSDVWQNVSKTQDKLSKKLGVEVKAAASSSSLQLTLESPAVRSAIAPYLAVGPIMDQHDDVIGFVAAVNGKVVSADVYASRSLFRKLWPILLEGSAVVAFIEADADHPTMPVDENAVRAFLREAENGKATGKAATNRTYVQVRNAERTMLLECCDRSRDNLVLHRSFLARRAD